jgi:ribosomal protein S18 acetylase RimI-like enzyme
MSEVEIEDAIAPIDPASAVPAGHNGGPPLDEHTPEWGNDGIGNYFYWKAAHRTAWKNASPGIVAFRMRKAERLGLTYEEYTLEILERGRHLQIEDVERIAQIKEARIQEFALSAEGTGVDQIAMTDVEIKALGPSPAARAMLSELLIEAVANGGSVSFMDPLPPETADKFWESALAAAARGERIVLGAFDGDLLVGTVTLVLDLSQNQPHRAEIVKMITRISHRGRGVATALLRRAESMALAHGRTLLVLDTASDGGAAPLYESMGFQLAGEIPDYAFKPQGGLTATKIYWKRLAATAAA